MEKTKTKIGSLVTVNECILTSLYGLRELAFGIVLKIDYNTIFTSNGVEISGCNSSPMDVAVYTVLVDGNVIKLYRGEFNIVN